MNLSEYALGLPTESKKRYMEKINIIGGIDPYALPAALFDKEKNLPELNIQKITDYLIFRISPFTQCEIKAYKSLGAFKQVACKWVKEIKTKTISNCVLVIGKASKI